MRATRVVRPAAASETVRWPGSGRSLREGPSAGDGRDRHRRRDSGRFELASVHERERDDTGQPGDRRHRKSGAPGELVDEWSGVGLQHREPPDRKDTADRPRSERPCAKRLLEALKVASGTVGGEVDRGEIGAGGNRESPDEDRCGVPPTGEEIPRGRPGRVPSLGRPDGLLPERPRPGRPIVQGAAWVYLARGRFLRGP